MRIRFTYDGKRRSGELVRFYHANNGNLIAKVKEDGLDPDKSFTVSAMGKIESGPYRTDEELMPILKAAAKSISNRIPGDYPGNPLELLVAATFTLVSGRNIDEVTGCVDEAVNYHSAEGK